MIAPLLSKQQAVKPLSIALINDRGFRYGAGMAVFRQAQSFLLAGHSVTLVAANLDTDWHRATDFSVLTSFPGLWRGILAAPALPQSTEKLSDAAMTEGVFSQLVGVLRAMKADVVIFGNIHGANWPLEWIGRLHKNFPQVVAFCHDAFYITGRCAYPGGCGRFLSGCDDACPTHGEYPALSPALIHPAWETRQKLFNQFDGVPIATNSHWLTDLARRRYPAATWIRPVHYGLDELAYAPIQRAFARKVLNLPLQETVICTGAVDASEYRKGGDLLLPLIEFFEKIPNVRVLVFGLLGPLHHKLAAFPHVRCVGYASPSEMPLLLSAADLFVGMSREEAFGQTFMEAAACGVPVVGFDVGGIGDIARHGETAILCEDTSFSLLASAVKELLNAPTQRHSFGRQARARVSTHFTLAAQAERWESFLNDRTSQS